MKKVLRILAKTLGGLIVLLLLVALVFWIKWKVEASSNMKLAGKEAPTLTYNGKVFRDLNKNGTLDVYEDKEADIEARIEDLLSQMTLEEKAGTMFVHMAAMKDGGGPLEIPSLNNPFSLLLESTSYMIFRKKMNHIGSMGANSALDMATWNNNLQKLAERTRLGIPVTVSTDPRHGNTAMPGASVKTRWLSTWPSQLGLGAIGDSATVREFGDIARQEYVAVGIRSATHPMADLATDPRWARTNGTFGEDAYLSARLTEAYILGFQGDTIGPTSVTCQTKHFSGGGPQEDGLDAHFASGKGQVYPGDYFDYHLIPFTEGAFKANTAQIMPYYGVPKGQIKEEVGFAFSKEIITDLLRDSLGFEGVVCTDWGIVSDMPVKKASAWGVEHLSESERMKKIIDAGCDMFGGEYDSELVVALVKEGKIAEERIDVSVRRILRDKFRLGLFDNPYVDLDKISIVGHSEFVEKGRQAQRRSMVLLKNEDHILPLAKDKKIYLSGISTALSERFPQIVENPEDADVIVQKLTTPSSPTSGGDFLERFFPQGRLDFPEEEKQEILELMKTRPTVTVLTMHRPPVIPEIDAASKAVIADFECEDEIILELIFGKFSPTGKLPIEIPSSVEAVENQMEDVPYDSKDPLYPFGHGLTF